MKCKLSMMGLGLALGVFWALSMLVLGLLSYYIDYGTTFVTAVNSLYLISEVTLGNVLISTVIAFVDGFIDGVIIAFLYNLFCGKCSCCSKKGE